MGLRLPEPVGTEPLTTQLARFPVFFGAFTLWSFTVVMLCAMVIYGLAVYGGKDDVDA